MGNSCTHWKVTTKSLNKKNIHFVYHHSGPHHGHYVSVVKSNGQWLLFDDDVVTVKYTVLFIQLLLTFLFEQQIQEDDIQRYFTDLPGSGSGYVLFYQAIDLNLDTINISLGKKTDERMNGGPVNLASSVSTPLNIQSPITQRREELLNVETPAPERKTPSPPPMEEKKTRWGLGRKKKDKK
jgi:hypothetical protein